MILGRREALWVNSVFIMAFHLTAHQCLLLGGYSLGRSCSHRIQEVRVQSKHRSWELGRKSWKADRLGQGAHSLHTNSAFQLEWKNSTVTSAAACHREETV